MIKMVAYAVNLSELLAISGYVFQQPLISVFPVNQKKRKKG
jgi:hypothetical protein